MPEKLHFISFVLLATSQHEVGGIDNYNLSTAPNMFSLPPSKEVCYGFSLREDTICTYAVLWIRQCSIFSCK